jgi:hypothetical protein
LTGDLRNKIWAECAMATTYPSNILKSPFELLFGSNPILHYELKIFGEVGVVTKMSRPNPSLPILDLLASLLAMRKTIQKMSTEC